MKKLFQTYKRSNDGATAVEFSLVALPFIMMLFGIIEVGRAVWTMNGVQYAVEQTGRYAALNSDLTNEEFQTYAENELSGMRVPSTSLQISSTTFTSSGVNFIEIEGDYSISSILTNLLPNNFGNFDFETRVRRPIID